jgi:hypothetical protein
MIEKPPTAEELKQAKEALLNSFVFNYASREQVLDQQMTFAYYGLPANYLDTHRAQIEKVTAEDVARAARKHMHPERMALLVVGRAEDFDRPLDSFGPVTTIDIAIPPPPGAPAPANPTSANRDAGQRLFSKMAETLSRGPAARVRSARLRFGMALKEGASVDFEVELILPDQVRQSFRSPAGEQTLVFQGGRGALLTAGPPQPVPPRLAEEARKSVAMDLLVLSGNAADPELVALAAGPGEVDGTPCDRVDVTYLGATSRLCIGVDGRPIEQSFEGQHPFQGTPGRVRIRFRDYAEIGGWLLPRRQEHTFEGEALASAELRSVEVNPELDAARFAIPAEAEEPAR